MDAVSLPGVLSIPSILSMEQEVNTARKTIPAIWPWLKCREACVY